MPCVSSLLWSVDAPSSTSDSWIDSLCSSSDSAWSVDSLWSSRNSNFDVRLLRLFVSGSMGSVAGTECRDCVLLFVLMMTSSRDPSGVLCVSSSFSVLGGRMVGCRLFFCCLPFNGCLPPSEAGGILINLSPVWIFMAKPVDGGMVGGSLCCSVRWCGVVPASCDGPGAVSFVAWRCGFGRGELCVVLCGLCLCLRRLLSSGDRWSSRVFDVDVFRVFEGVRSRERRRLPRGVL